MGGKKDSNPMDSAYMNGFAPRQEPFFIPYIRCGTGEFSRFRPPSLVVVPPKRQLIKRYVTAPEKEVKLCMAAAGGSHRNELPFFSIMCVAVGFLFHCVSGNPFRIDS